MVGELAGKIAETANYGISLLSKTAAMIAMSLYRLGVGNPPVLLGPLPLYRVKHFEVARSQEVTEFRAIGAAFLGQQKGGNLGIRIDCEYDQTEILNVLAVLFLLEMGRGEEVEYKVPRDPLSITEDLTNNKIVSIPVVNAAYKGPTSIPYNFRYLDYLNYLSAFKQISPMFSTIPIGGISTTTIGSSISHVIGSFSKDFFGGIINNITEKASVTVNNVVPVENNKSLAYRAAVEGKTIANTNDKDAEWRRTVKHRTFPILTQYEIIFDCFVETVMFKRNVKDGKNVITVSILCRQYQPDEYPKSEQLYAVSDAAMTNEDDFPVYNEKNSKLQSLIEMAPTVAKVTGRAGKVLDFLDLNKGALGVDWVVNATYRTGVCLFRRNFLDEQLRERQIRNMGVYTYLLNTIRQLIQKKKTMDVSQSIEKRDIIAEKTMTAIIV